MKGWFFFSACGVYFLISLSIEVFQLAVFLLFRKATKRSKVKAKMIANYGQIVKTLNFFETVMDM